MFCWHKFEKKIVDERSPELYTYRKCVKCGKVQVSDLKYGELKPHIFSNAWSRSVKSIWKDTTLTELPLSLEEEFLSSIKGKIIPEVYEMLLDKGVRNYHYYRNSFLDISFRSELDKYAKSEEGQKITKVYEDKIKKRKEKEKMDYLVEKYGIVATNNENN